MEKSITQLLEDILSAVYGEDVRKSIHDAILKSYEDATKGGNANMEVSQARGIYSSLSERLAADLSNTIKKINDGDSRLRTIIDSVVSGSPLAASSISEMTDTSRIYVNTSDGYWYYHNGTSWVQGEIYQGTVPNKNSVAGSQIYLGNQTRVRGIENNYRDPSGSLIYNTNYMTTDFIPIVNGDVINYTNAIGDYAIFFDINKNYISKMGTSTLIEERNVTINILNVAYVIFNFRKNYEHQVKINGKNVNYFYNIPWLDLLNENIKDNSLFGHKISDNSLIPQKIYRSVGIPLSNGSIWSKNSPGYITNYNGYSRTTDKIEVNPGDKIRAINVRATWLVTFDENEDAIRDYSAGSTLTNTTIVINDNVRYVGFDFTNTYINQCEIYINEQKIHFDTGLRYTLDWLRFTDEQLEMIGTTGNERFRNYKTLFIGDSITEHNYRATTNWVDNITSWLHINNYLNGGMSGTGILKPFGAHQNWLDTLPTYSNDYDMILIMGDMNDWSSKLFTENNLGQFGDSTTDTFYGTLKVYIEAILAKYPLAKIGWITSTPRNQHIADTTDYLHGNTSIFKRASEIIKEMCANYSIPVLDLYNESNLYPWITANNQEYFKPEAEGYNADGIHPNSKGQLIMSYKIYDFIKRNF